MGTILALAAGVWADPHSIGGVIGPDTWPKYGLHITIGLGLLSMVAVAVLVINARTRAHTRARTYVMPGLQRAIAVTTLLATVLSGLVVGTFVGAVKDAGGEVSLTRALQLEPADSATPDTLETYTTIDGAELTMDVYAPPSAQDAPVMLFIHGGGWSGGTPGENSRDLRYFADKGFVVMSVQYRLATATIPTWDKAPRDVACAASWALRNAPRWGGSSTELVVAGDSAGGNLALNLAYGAAEGAAVSGCGGEVPVPVAVIAQYPVVSLESIVNKGFGIGTFKPDILTSDYLGAPIAEQPERRRTVDSSTYINPQAPNTLLIIPMRDAGVPVEDTLFFASEARAEGVDVTVAELPFASHAYDVALYNSLGNQAHRTIALHYLSQQGLID